MKDIFKSKKVLISSVVLVIIAVVTIVMNIIR